VGACGSSSHSASGGSSPTTGSAGSAAGGKGGAPITIGFITDATGALSSSFIGAAAAAQARISAQNAAGGVNGHQLKLVIEDDASTPAGNQTAAQVLVQDKGAFGVIEDSIVTFGGSKYLNQAGVPVVGAAVDGPEWNEQPNTNMFSVSPPSSAPIGGVYYSWNTNTEFFKGLGVKKLASWTYNSPAGITADKLNVAMAKSLGLSSCYDNTSVNFGATDFTPLALAIKSAGCDGALSSALLNSDIAFSQALKNAGVNVPELYYTAYDQNLLNNPAAVASMQGDYTIEYVDFIHPDAAAQQLLANLKKYANFTTGFPSLNVTYAYEEADLMIKGLEVAGSNPTRPAFISNLRNVDSYNAGGLITSPVTFQHFGTVGILPKTSCELIAQIKGNGYVPYNNGKPVCGTLFAMK
jgi:branched-chain amino acid transport system substrate-binding protein